MVELIKKACPICLSDVKGDDSNKFYCAKCNILYDRKHLVPAKQIYIDNRPQSILTLSDDELDLKYIVSLKSTKYHWIRCPYIKKIKHENLFYFNTELDASKNDYEPCVCIKRRIKTKYTFVRSSVGDEYHTPSCPYAQKIKLENRIFFNDELDALDKGLKRCQCLQKNKYSLDDDSIAKDGSTKNKVKPKKNYKEIIVDGKTKYFVEVNGKLQEIKDINKYINSNKI